MGIEKNIVFIVDDDPAVLDALKFALELDGLDVRVCTGGAEALAHPDLSTARCFIIDYKMPSMDGIDLIGALRNADVAAPVILMTSAETKLLRQRARNAGVNFVIEKPLMDSALTEAVHGALHPSSSL